MSDLKFKRNIREFRLLGGVRSAGVMYVGIMNHFRATREEASWPLSVMGAMLSLISEYSMSEHRKKYLKVIRVT